MIHEQKVLGVVPARSGSKGIVDKNMQMLGGKSLIAHAGDVLAADECSFVDRRIISTDSEAYAAEGARHGLEAPFLRPAGLSGDRAGAAETIAHAIAAAESHYSESFDMVLIVEPTSPLRRPEDIRGTAELLIATGADSVVTVSPLDTKFHPDKLLAMGRAGALSFHSERGRGIQYRQALTPLYYRNGACYALRVRSFRLQRSIIMDDSRGFVIDRWMVNIDAPEELELLRRAAESRKPLFYGGAA
jgi:CMP-N-acetylneuraminic acid synthetase